MSANSNISLNSSNALQHWGNLFTNLDEAMDGAFKMLVYSCPDLVLCFLEWVLGMKFPAGARVLYGSSETALPLYDTLISQKIGDALLCVVDQMRNPILWVHIECQTVVITLMSERLMEYSFTDALNLFKSGMARLADKQLVKSAIPVMILIQIRESQRIKDPIEMEIGYGDVNSPLVKQIYPAKVVRMKDYSLGELLERERLLLMPFYFVNYETKLDKNGDLSEVIVARIHDEYSRILLTLRELEVTEVISRRESHSLQLALAVVFRKMAIKHLHQFEEVLKTMMTMFYVDTRVENSLKKENALMDELAQKNQDLAQKDQDLAQKDQDLAQSKADAKRLWDALVEVCTKTGAELPAPPSFS